MNLHTVGIKSVPKVQGTQGHARLLLSRLDMLVPKTRFRKLSQKQLLELKLLHGDVGGARVQTPSPLMSI